MPDFTDNRQTRLAYRHFHMRPNRHMHRCTPDVLRNPGDNHDVAAWEHTQNLSDLISSHDPSFNLFLVPFLLLLDMLESAHPGLHTSEMLMYHVPCCRKYFVVLDELPVV